MAENATASGHRKGPRWARGVRLADDLQTVTQDLARTLISALHSQDGLSDRRRPIRAETYFRRLSQLVDRVTAASQTGVISPRDVAALSAHIRKFPYACADGAQAAAPSATRWLRGLAAELTAANGPGEPLTRLEHAAQLFATIADIIEASRREASRQRRVARN